MRKRFAQNQLKHYILGTAVFIVFLLSSLMVFFVCIQREVNKGTENTIVKYVDRQRYHFQTIMDIHFSFLEGMAGYFGETSELLSEENKALLSHIHRESSFERMAIIDLEGNSYYDNGEVANVREREYFQKALGGERCLSEPIVSKVDQHGRVVLCVPVFRGEKVLGVVCASYNLSELTRLLFEDIYDGQGYCSIISTDGRVISIDTPDQEKVLREEGNFFDYYGALEYKGHRNMEDVRRDFKAQAGGCIRLHREDDHRFLAYEPLGYNDWMLCYVVPVGIARASYTFINDYESVLAGCTAVGVLLLVLYILRINTRKDKALLHYAETDALTGCRNKRSTEELIDERLSRGGGQLNAFLMMDVDKFKEINDVYGHAVGDEVLHAIGKKLRSGFRDRDIVGRIGGDEFVVFMENVDSRETAVARVQRLREALLGMRFSSMGEKGITVSMGLAFAPAGGESFSQVYVKADEALYRTKRGGRNGLTVYEEDRRTEDVYDITTDPE
ncbi:MAG: diguanylate cyclase [Eubacteriales bacterium]|nr:diguanylate cyclase [Eubacteriales bacterium]